MQIAKFCHIIYFEHIDGANCQGFKIGPDQTPRLTYVDFLPRCLRPGTKLRKPVFDNFK